MPAAKMLVVTSDYDVLQRIRTVLEAESITVFPGYSHLDALTLLNNNEFDAALIDAQVADSRTGEPTFAIIARMANGFPRIIYHPKTVKLNHRIADIGEVLLNQLDEESIRGALHYALSHHYSGAATGGISGIEGLAQIPRFKPGIVNSVWSAEEVQTFLTLSRSLTEVLDLSDVLNRVVEAARDLTNAEEGMILLPDGETDQLYLRAKVGIEQDVARNFRVKTQDTLAGYVFKNGSPALIGASGPQKVKTEYFVNSLLYVPILLKNKPIGVLGVNNKQRHDTFDERHQELLLNLAAYAAIAIENARIHGQSIKRARELKALVDASEQMNQSLQLEHTLQTTCDQCVRVLNVNDALIYQWNRENGSLQLLGRNRRQLWRSGQEPLVPFGQQSKILQALKSRQPIWIDRNDQSDDVKMLESFGAQTLLTIPITGERQVLGALLVYYTIPPVNAPTPEILGRVRQLTLDSVLELAKGRDRNTGPVFKNLDDINALLEAQWSEVALLAGETQLALQAAVGADVWLDATISALNLENAPDLRYLLETLSPLNTHKADISNGAGARAILEQTQNNMLLALPLAQRGTGWGMVVFGDSSHDHVFSSRELDLARAVVGQAGTALENAGLYSELQASLQELQATQARLIQAARLSAMGELAAAVAHQINNPLTTILSDSELLLEHSQPHTPQYESVSAIVRASKRAKAVVRRLLAAVRTVEPSGFDTVNVIATIEETLALVRPYIEREKMRLHQRLPDGKLPPIRAIPGELDDVWLNLLLNAHDALTGRPNPELGIQVEYLPARGVIEVQVWDNGPGIPPEISEEIFKPFFTTKPPGEGTGLGLHIARQIIDRVGGAISVESMPDVGTRFFVSLPVLR
jgi:signal transduction histidine kinase